MKKVLIIVLTLAIMFLFGGPFIIPVEAESQPTTIFMLGRSVMEGWFYHWGWDGDDYSPVSFNGYSLYHRTVDGPTGDGSNMVDSVDSIAGALPSGQKSLFFKLCFVDFEGGSQAAANANLARNQEIIEGVYDSVVEGDGIDLIIGNALPRVAADTDQYLVENHQSYNAWLDDFSDDYAGNVYIFDQYSALADSNGNLKAAYAVSASDSHLNDQGYDALDTAYTSFLDNDYNPDTPSPGPGPAHAHYRYVTGAGPGGGPQVLSYGTNGQRYQYTNFFAYANTYRGGTRVATGDIDADGWDEIITGTGEDGGPHLRAFEQDGTPRGIEFFLKLRDGCCKWRL